jgi:hypothetical protein
VQRVGGKTILVKAQCNDALALTDHNSG